MHRVVGKLIFKGTMLQNLIIFYLFDEIKNYASKLKAILTIFERKKKQLQPLLLSTSVAPLQQTR
jgi:hypothetical protein